MTDRLTIATPACVADDFGGEIVALNLETGFYFSLRDLAAAIWRDLAAGHPRETVVAAITAADEALGEHAGRLIDRILTEGLMRPAEPDAAAPEGAPTVALFVAEGTTAIAIDSYDDLRDLVTTDPIHEVDEGIGWPVRREEA